MSEPGHLPSPELVGRLSLTGDLVALLRHQLPEVAGDTISAITDEVPAYARAFGGPMGANIENAVQMALAGFLRLATQGRRRGDPTTPASPAIEGAYALGRGEARNGRSVDALLAAYRVGARVAWRELSQIAVSQGVSADIIAEFAELVFAYIDELSAASVAGHADQLAISGRVRERYLERLVRLLLEGAPEHAVITAAERAEWKPVPSLTAVLLPEAQVRSVITALDERTLVLAEDLPGAGPDEALAVLLVPGGGTRGRTTLLRHVAGRHAVVGPARPWVDAGTSYQRAVRALPLRSGTEALDTERHLAEIVLGADPEALADLRAEVLAPLADLKPAAAEKLTETLRSWLLHQGRREEVADELFVHPQTVRYRLGQLRDLYGDRLDDPRTMLNLTIALGAGPE